MKFLIIIVLIILGIRMLRKSVYFSVYSNLNRKMQDDIKKYQGQQSKREGEVTIDTSGAGKRNKNNDDGEYVDYTEVK